MCKCKIISVDHKLNYISFLMCLHYSFFFFSRCFSLHFLYFLFVFILSFRFFAFKLCKFHLVRFSSPFHLIFHHILRNVSWFFSSLWNARRHSDQSTDSWFEKNANSQQFFNSSRSDREKDKRKRAWKNWNGLKPHYAKWKCLTRFARDSFFIFVHHVIAFISLFLSFFFVSWFCAFFFSSFLQSLLFLILCFIAYFSVLHFSFGFSFFSVSIYFRFFFVAVQLHHRLIFCIYVHKLWSPSV